jgi:hypothetical protein
MYAPYWSHLLTVQPHWSFGLLIVRGRMIEANEPRPVPAVCSQGSENDASATTGWTLQYHTLKNLTNDRLTMRVRYGFLLRSAPPCTAPTSTSLRGPSPTRSALIGRPCVEFPNVMSMTFGTAVWAAFTVNALNKSGVRMILRLHT